MLIPCFECKEMVSDLAKICPHCGAVLERGFQIIPRRRKLVVQDYKNEGAIKSFSWLTKGQVEGLNEIFSQVDKLKRHAPGLYQLVKDFLSNGKVGYKAIIDSKIQSMLDAGELTLVSSKADKGIKAMLYRVKDGKIVPGIDKQINLEECLEVKELTPDVLAIQTQMSLARIEAHLIDIKKSIDGLYGEFHSDRMATADSVINELAQASLVKNDELRSKKLLLLTGKATEARNKLQKEVGRRISEIKKELRKSGLASLFDSKDFSGAAEEIFESIKAISSMVQAEALCWNEMEEQEVAIEVLKQCSEFFKSIDIEDSIYKINSAADNSESSRKKSHENLLLGIMDFINELDCVISRQNESKESVYPLSEEDEDFIPVKNSFSSADNIEDSVNNFSDGTKWKANVGGYYDDVY